MTLNRFPSAEQHSVRCSRREGNCINLSLTLSKDYRITIYEEKRHFVRSISRTLMVQGLSLEQRERESVELFRGVLVPRF